MELKVYRCNHCKNTVLSLNDSGVQMICCGEEMKEVVAGSVDAAREKHVPKFTKENNLVKVCVGEVTHPMQEVHYIEWIALETKEGLQVKNLLPGQAPEATFALTESDEVVAVYAYCNLHGLWVAK